MANESAPAPYDEAGGSDSPSVFVAEPRESERPDIVLPRDPQTVFLGGLFFLAVLTAFYVAREIILPVILAIVLKLLLQPAVYPFERLRIHRAIAALIVVVLVSSTLVGFVAVVAGPAMGWMEKLPEGLPRLEEHLKTLTQSIAEIQEVLKRAESAAQTSNDGTPTVAVKGIGLSDMVFSGTFNATVGILTTILLLFFLLAAGDTFLRHLVEVLPRFKDKRQAVDIVQHIERDVSAYLLTISAINLAVGIATGLAMYLCGIGDAVLWGAMAFLLNYIPILGPLVGVGLFALVGLLSFESLGAALLPAGLYLLIHVIEGEIITPLVVARRLTLNPVLVILSLIFWYWMWGVPGAILAVPILAITKITCDRIRPLMAIGHFLEG